MARTVDEHLIHPGLPSHGIDPDGPEALPGQDPAHGGNEPAFGGLAVLGQAWGIFGGTGDSHGFVLVTW